ncbi:hypothetical protein [Methylomicrobium lacus]|uniref:hypothetical protein n=1 Tax=Methylomicrobium lacus TaxID=136992 RepID=UPI0035A9334B
MRLRIEKRLIRKSYFGLGLGLLGAFFAQEIQRWQWPWLAGWQVDSVYKQLSGLVLIIFLGQQWHCSLLRNQGCTARGNSLLPRHKWFGALAPLFFYAHAQHLGYGYLQALSGSFFVVFFTGLFNCEIMHIRQPWFRPVWLILHVGLATALLFLIGYHVAISYVYE